MLISQALAQNPPPIARDAVVVGGSYQPKDGTAQSMLGDTYAITGLDGDQYIPQPADVATTQIGDQYGPVGGERVVLIPTQGGPVKLFIHDEDDSPRAPAGERWITHRNANGQADSYLKHKNDGPTAGDGLGGVLSNGGALHQTSTSGGHQISLNNKTKQILVKTSNAMCTLSMTDLVLRYRTLPHQSGLATSLAI